MSMVINTNLSSLTAQRHLANSRADMETAMERLSSGKRINSAMDDAAGLSISHSMKAQVTSMNQATRNANDGIAMINLAEGAMDQITTMLTRMKELATQSANGIYQENDRANLDAEFDALKGEITRIANVTVYNGVNVLNAEATVGFQVGDNSSDQVEVTFNDMRSTAIGSSGTATTYTLDTSFAAVDESDDADYDGSTDGAQAHAAADTSGDQAAGAEAAQISGFVVTDDLSDTTQVLRISVAGETFTQQVLDGATSGARIDATLTALKTQINDAGLDITASVTSSLDGATADTFVLTADDANTPFTVTSLGLYDVTDGDATATIQESGIDTGDNATSAMTSLDTAIQQVDTYRSNLGAVANRLEHTVGNLMTRTQHTSAAMSRIMDADYATESANLAKAQVLQQAGTAMLAQANASTQNVLSLLK